jgi:hypothetical protein
LATCSESLLVAGIGIEPMSRGYEPRELPLLYPAIFLDIPIISHSLL